MTIQPPFFTSARSDTHLLVGRCAGVRQCLGGSAGAASAGMQCGGARESGKSHLLDRLQRATSWQRVGSTTSVDTARRATERLREFEHGHSSV